MLKMLKIFFAFMLLLSSCGKNDGLRDLGSEDYNYLKLLGDKRLADLDGDEKSKAEGILKSFFEKQDYKRMVKNYVFTLALGIIPVEMCEKLRKSAGGIIDEQDVDKELSAYFSNDTSLGALSKYKPISIIDAFTKGARNLAANASKSCGEKDEEKETYKGEEKEIAENITALVANSPLYQKIYQKIAASLMN